MLKIKKNGLTLVEILVAIAIMAILAAGLYSVSQYVDRQVKVKLTESTIEILTAAIDEYHDFYKKFPFEAGESYGKTELKAFLKGDVTNNAVPPVPLTDYNDVYASIEALYHFLNKCPGSKKIVNTINPSLITNKDNKNKEYFFTPTVGQAYPLMHIIDSWKTPLRYTYKSGDNFPVITSAGPDRDFGETDPGKKDDNITSR